MTDRDIYNLTLNAKYARDFCELCTNIGRIRVGDLIHFCAPRIEHRDERLTNESHSQETYECDSLSVII